ncbi:hypothetical protein ACFLZJ_00270 [Nanoarchaeota archaeon]
MLTLDRRQFLGTVPLIPFAIKEMLLQNKQQGMTPKEIYGIRNYAENKIPQLNEHWSNIEAEKLRESLTNMLENSHDRDGEYMANYYLGLLHYIDLNGKRTDSKAFGFWETCVFQYPDVEDMVGLVGEACEEIAFEFSKKRQLIGTSRLYELAKKSTARTRDEKDARQYLDRVLEKDIGNQDLINGIKDMFKPDGLAFNPRHSANQTGQRSVQISRGIFRKYDELSRSTKPIKIFSITPYMPFPKMTIEDVGSVFTYKEKRTDKGVEGELYIDSGITIRKLLEAGGVDPYNWVFPSKSKDIW